jgi:lauroyl/myristoyl acyltransferase
LMDRPPQATGVPVMLFGKTFSASISAAELARASGCAVLPVYLPRTSRGYTAQILPEIAYDRQLMGNREARVEFTQKIMTAFEPAIRLYLNQWYHFVPIWPRES